MNKKSIRVTKDCRVAAFHFENQNGTTTIGSVAYSENGWEIRFHNSSQPDERDDIVQTLPPGEAQQGVIILFGALLQVIKRDQFADRLIEAEWGNDLTQHFGIITGLCSKIVQVFKGYDQALDGTPFMDSDPYID